MKKLIAAGIVLLTLGIFPFSLAVNSRGEKDAFLFRGHWWDVFWEIQLPLLVAGTVLFIIGFIRRKFHK